MVSSAVRNRFRANHLFAIPTGGTRRVAHRPGVADRVDATHVVAAGKGRRGVRRHVLRHDRGSGPLGRQRAALVRHWGRVNPNTDVLRGRCNSEPAVTVRDPIASAVG